MWKDGGGDESRKMKKNIHTKEIDGGGRVGRTVFLIIRGKMVDSSARIIMH